SSIVMSDWELLQSWAREQSESAFAALVHRHVNLVYGSALRQMRDAELAGDATQAMFLLLSRKAKTLRREVILSGWLFRATSQTDRPPRPAAPPSPFRQPYDTSFRKRLFEQEIYDRSVNRVPPGRFRGRFLPRGGCCARIIYPESGGRRPKEFDPTRPRELYSQHPREVECSGHSP
ncbi:MAG TPA: sigma factor, partial [Verrucomicrobiae bacterium]|nr:sigma factor [Verrucomicrobiae bacterium]